MKKDRGGHYELEMLPCLYIPAVCGTIYNTILCGFKRNALVEIPKEGNYAANC